MPPPSMARAFFDQIRTAADPIAFIRSLVNPTLPTYETDWLDFKRQPSTDLKHAKWRDMWVEALAAFANNQGGVIIWGIDARKDPATNVDAASGEKPVANPAGVKSRLIELQRQATDPPLANVEIDAYEIASAPGTGFVVCLVPEGPFKPYRAEDGRKSQYYIRAGDNFVIMSRSVLQSLFYPRSQVVFRAKADLSWDLNRGCLPNGDHVAAMSCKVELVNRGTATAKDAFILLESNIRSEVEELALRGPPAFWSIGRAGSDNDIQAGFVVCLVPEGPFKPYRAEDGRKSQYYIRAGDNFVIMSRSVLQSLFYPRSQVVFRAKADLSWDLNRGCLPNGDHVAAMSCKVELVNRGTATAKDAFILLESNIRSEVEELALRGPSAPCTQDGRCSFLSPNGV